MATLTISNLLLPRFKGHCRNFTSYCKLSHRGLHLNHHLHCQVGKEVPRVYYSSLSLSMASKFSGDKFRLNSVLASDLVSFY